MLWFWRSFRPGWHPWLFMLALGTLIASLVAGDVLVAVVMVLAVAWTLGGCSVVSDVGECGSCKAPVIWTLTPSGSKSPVDRDPSEKGNTLLLRQSHLGILSVVLSKTALELARRAGIELRLNHWATCPDKAAWRERTAAKKEGDGAAD